MNLKTILFTMFFTMFALIFGIPATTNALTVSPPLMEIDANPEDVIEKEIKIIAEMDVADGIYYHQ